MRFLVVQDVFPEFLALNDLDIRRQTYHEATGALKAVDSGPEEPFAILAFEIFFRQGEFLQEKALRPGIQLQDNFLVDFRNTRNCPGDKRSQTTFWRKMVSI